MKTGRNENCPCGSNLKYKNCCEKKESAALTRNRLPIILGVLAIAAGIAAIFRPSDPAGEKAAVAQTRTAYPSPVAVPVEGATPISGATAAMPALGRPTGQTPALATVADTSAPVGKVWSKEHGHYHDKTPDNPVKIQMATPQGSGALQQPPPGAAAAGGAGQVWNEKHGHYHPSSGATPQVAAARAAGSRKQVAGVPTTGQVWSEEHKHWHSAPAGTPGAIPMVNPPITTTNQ